MGLGNRSSEAVIAERDRRRLELRHPGRFADEITLCKIDTQFLEQHERFRVLYILCDRLHAGFVTDFCNELDHFLVYRVVEQVLYKGPIDLDVVELQFLQVAE